MEPVAKKTFLVSYDLNDAEDSIRDLGYVGPNYAISVRCIKD